MTFFSEQNKDALSVAPEEAAYGPMVGFLEGFKNAVDLQKRTSSQFGIEYFMHEQDWQQTRELAKRGEKLPPQLINVMDGIGYEQEFTPFRSEGYLDVARAYNNEDVGEPTRRAMLTYDRKIEELQAKYPDLKLKTTRQMWDDVKTKAQQAEETNAMRTKSWGGLAGDFIGSTLASLNPQTDPLNFYSLGLGGAGKTAVSRIAVQAGSQGAVEALNQITGVQRERDLLGLSNGTADALYRVAGAAAGGAAVQGLGEVAGKLYGKVTKRWFNHTPEDPAPPRPEPKPVAEVKPEAALAEQGIVRAETPGVYVPARSPLDDVGPLSGLKYARSRNQLDLDTMTAKLDDWGAGPVSEIRPRTDNVTFVDAPALPKVDTTALESAAAKYAAAKEVDPEAFRLYEAVRQKADTYRKWIAELGDQLNNDVQTTLDAMSAKIDDLYAKIPKTQGKANKIAMKDEIRQIKADREALLSAGKETPDIAQIRRALMKEDERMRELAPALGRAYAQAEGRWGAAAEEAAQIWEGYKAGRAPSAPVPEAVAYSPPLGLVDQAPIMARATPELEGETAADTVRNILAAEAKHRDEVLDAYNEQIASILKVEGESTVNIGGKDYTFDLDADRIEVMTADGPREMSIRQVLEDVDESKQELEAVSTCSIQKA